MTRIMRRVLPVALAVGAALASPAAANHGPCEVAGGRRILTGNGPTNATLCVYVGANAIMAGTDLIHECDSSCTLAGARASYDAGGQLQVCVAIIYEGTWIVDNRCVTL